MIDKKIIEKLKNGGIGILPTDTIYGLVGSALVPKTVERIYRLRSRDPKKPMIILIGDFSDLKKFDIKIDEKMRMILKKYWP
ncbi:threonylcarbamoyl-AMP synthase, partial [Candidatus Shapirobacteria bacterium CG10_big_fil_rev_8_21_14_0_10_40_9]